MNKLTRFSLSAYGDIKPYNDVLSQVRCRIFYKYGNRNGTYITDEFAEKLISSLPYTPVKGIYSELEQDYTDHGKERTEGRIYGIVPENPNFAWESHLDEDGVARTYACADVLLFTGIYKEEALQIVQKAQSMELFTDSIEGKWQFINGQKYYVFTEGHFLGLQVLGDAVEPCFEGAAFYTLVDSIKNVIDAIEQYDLEQKQTGEKEMDFKLSDNQKYNMLWTLLNPEEYRYSLCDIYDDYAIAFDCVEQRYVRAYYVKNDETDSVEITDTQNIFIMDVTEEEKNALNMLRAINGDTFEKIDEAVSSLKEENAAFEQKKEEFEATISTLEQEKTDLQTELEGSKEQFSESEAAREALENEKVELTNQLNELNEFKAAVELHEKEMVIEKYSAQLDAEVLESFRSSIDSYTKETLDKELAFALVQSKPSLFSENSEGSGYVPKDGGEPTGIEAILSRYKK